MRKFVLFFPVLFAAPAWCQAPVINSYTTAITGVTAIGPGTEIYILGTFTPHSAGRDYTITVGGQTGGINVADGAQFISATIPVATPAGATTLAITYQGQASNALPITISLPQPQLGSVGVLISSATAPPDFEPYYPIVHNSTNQPVEPNSPASANETLQVFVSGIGPEVAPGVSPTVSVAGIDASILKVSAASSGGNETVYFVVPTSAPNGIEPVIVQVAGVNSNTVTIPIGNGPLIGATVNAGSFGSAGVVSAGSILSVFGAGFGTQNNFASFPSTNVNGISVLFDGVAGPIFALAGPGGQINVMAPNELPSSGTVNLTIQNGASVSAAQTLTLVPATPGMFYYTDPVVLTRHNAVAVTANTAWIAMPTSMATNMGLSTTCSTAATLCGQPAKRGGYLQIYVTGLGKATPNGDPNGAVLPTGTVAPVSGDPIYYSIAPPVVTIGGQPATVVFSGLAPGFAGLYQVDVQIPTNIPAGNDVPLSISLGGQTDSDTVALQ